ncbi:1-alkyl-2-acetylglycerophosphocholine esterase, partial [Streptococcus gordonii]|nr:1-alkyl-2-acetylglycerophosphocholine esterase [Streptococcus gordonii]
NRAYQGLASNYTNVQFIDLYETLLDETGQLDQEFTTYGLHLTIAGYALLSSELDKYL